MNDDLTGKVIGPYRLQRRIHAGGMGTLYAATHDNNPRQEVGVKILHDHLSRDPQVIRLFEREAAIAGRVQHPNVVRVGKFEQFGGTWLIEMELVRGVSLSQMLRSTAAAGEMLSPAAAVHIALETTKALRAAHETRAENGEKLGLVHRDVSPQNVLLSVLGEVKLIDFGVAKAGHLAGLTAPTTRTGMIRGKLAYMAPEQAVGGSIDSRSDLYALGIVLWEMLTSRRLFYSKTPLELLKKVKDPNVPPPSRFAPLASRELDAVVLWMLSAKPKDRPQNADELIARLETVAGVYDPREVLRLVLAAEEWSFGTTSSAQHTLDRTQPTQTIPSHEAFTGEDSAEVEIEVADYAQENTATPPLDSILPSTPVPQATESIPGWAWPAAAAGAAALAVVAWLFLS